MKRIGPTFIVVYCQLNFQDVLSTRTLLIKIFTEKCWDILAASWTVTAPSPLHFDLTPNPIVSLLSLLWKVIFGPCFQQASFLAHSLFAGMDSCVPGPSTYWSSLLPSPWSVVNHRLHRHNSENLASCVAYELYRTNIQGLEQAGSVSVSHLPGRECRIIHKIEQLMRVSNGN